jgi:hypothetical protein
VRRHDKMMRSRSSCVVVVVVAVVALSIAAPTTYRRINSAVNEPLCTEGEMYLP